MLNLSRAMDCCFGFGDVGRRILQRHSLLSGVSDLGPFGASSRVGVHDRVAEGCAFRAFGLVLWLLEYGLGFRHQFPKTCNHGVPRLSAQVHSF